MTRRSSIVAQSKEAEREIARLLGGRRLHAGEWHGAGDVDVLGLGWVAQVKHRAAMPGYIIEGMRQIEEATEGTSLIPLLVIRTKPGRGRKAEVFVLSRPEIWAKTFVGEDA